MSPLHRCPLCNSGVGMREGSHTFNCSMWPSTDPSRSCHDSQQYVSRIPPHGNGYTNTLGSQISTLHYHGVIKMTIVRAPRVFAGATTFCSDETRPPTRDETTFSNAAELKRRFQSHHATAQRHLFTELGGWEVFQKCTRTIFPAPKWQEHIICTRVTDDPPTHQTMQGCEAHTSTLCSPPQPFAVMRPDHPPNR